MHCDVNWLVCFHGFASETGQALSYQRGTERQVKERERQRERRWNSKGKVTRKFNKGCESSNKGNTILNTMESLYRIIWCLEMTLSQLLALNWLLKFASPSLEEFFNNLLSPVSSFLCPSPLFSAFYSYLSSDKGYRGFSLAAPSGSMDKEKCPTSTGLLIFFYIFSQMMMIHHLRMMEGGISK